MKPQIFYPFMYSMAFIAGLKLLWDGAQQPAGRRLTASKRVVHIAKQNKNAAAHKFLAARGDFA